MGQAVARWRVVHAGGESEVTADCEPGFDGPRIIFSLEGDTVAIFNTWHSVERIVDDKFTDATHAVS